MPEFWAEWLMLCSSRTSRPVVCSGCRTSGDPRQLRPPATRMFSLRWRELREHPCASPAVHTVLNSTTEPQSSASFTYFEAKAQVVHRFLVRHGTPPASLRIFQRSSGLAQVAMRRFGCHAELSEAPVVGSIHANGMRSERCTLREKCGYTPSSFSTRVQP